MRGGSDSPSTMTCFCVGGDVFFLIYFLEFDSISVDGRSDEITGESVPCDFKVNKRRV